jgi:RND family efflux transporter MFP subunit
MKMIPRIPWRAAPGTATAALLALGACSTARPAETKDDLDSPVAIRVEAAASIVRPSAITASGAVEPRTTVDVAFQVAGRVATVGPDDGDAVSEGELLAELDPTDYRLAVEQTSAAAEHAAGERDRYRPLLDAGSVAPNDLDRMESAARQSAAAAALARKRLTDTRLLSPISGSVARRAIERGTTVASGQSVFTLVDLDVVNVRIGVAEADIDKIRAGQPATIRLPALGEASFAGRVTSVGVSADPTTRTYAVEISVPNATRRLKAGMIAEATVEANQATTAITVPATAVVRNAEGATVLYLLDPNTRRVHARRVTVGATRGAGARLEIASGISAGDLVVVAGQQRLRDGSLTTMSTAEAAESAR